jgi:hypothetical protein
MKPNSLLLAVAAASISLISTGCAGNALKLAAVDTGKAQARVTLPSLPDDCRKEEPHAALAVGMEVRVALRAERRALDRQNARTGRCAAFYDATKAGLE